MPIRPIDAPRPSDATDRPASGPPTRRRTGRRPGLEPLEGRALLATFTVSSLDDAGTGTLREAIELANAAPDRDTIAFAPEVRGSIDLEAALPDLATPIDLEGPGAADLTITGGDSRIFNVAEEAEVAISGLRIARGRGGIVNAGTLTITASAVADNSTRDPLAPPASPDSGGGVANTGTLTIVDSTISGNSVGGFNGTGGPGYGGGIFNSGTQTVSGSTISGNSADATTGIGMRRGPGIGGGIYNTGRLTVTDSTFSDNVATDGGGGIAIAPSAEARVTGSTFAGNQASTGGGIWGSGTLTITRSTIEGNGVDSSGGGISNSGTMTIATSSIIRNSTSNFLHAQGGGIDNSGTLDVINSTISGNIISLAGIGAARGAGGGINNTGTLTVVHSTITGNTVGGRAPENGAGGGIAGGGTITNSIVAGNSAPSDPDLGGASTPLGRNLIGDSVDPMLAPLGDNGGPTQTHALLPGSPAIDAGDAVEGVTTDQRGFARNRGAAPDIGAYERAAGVVIISSGPGSQFVPVGKTATVGLTFLGGPGGGPRAGVPVSFRIVSGPNSGAPGGTTPADGRTDAGGRISFTYDGPSGPGVDTIAAVATIDGETVDGPQLTVRRFLPNTSADYDGDGRADFATYSYDQAVGGRFLIGLSGGGTVNQPLGGLADRPIVGDFDGDGISDLGVYGFSPIDGFSRYALVRSSDGVPSVGGFGGPADRPVVGNFDGDDRDDLAVFGPGLDGANRFAVLPSSDPANAYLVPFGGPSDLPLAGDFDGDGREDLAVYGPGPDGINRFAVRPSGNPDAAYAVPFGGLGDTPVVGDFDGDGTDDLAVYGFSPLDGFSRFAIRPSGNPGAAYPVAFGGGQDAPIGADFDGDGRTDIAVYGFSPLDGEARFAVLRSSDGRATSTPMGNADALGLPIAPGRFRPPATLPGTATARLRASQLVAMTEDSGTVPRPLQVGTDWRRLVDEALGQLDADGPGVG